MRSTELHLLPRAITRSRAVFVLGLWMLVGLAQADIDVKVPDAKAAVRVVMRPQTPKLESIAGKRVAITVKENPALTAIVVKSLADRGIQVVDGGENADLKVSVIGRFSFAKPFAPEVGGMLRDLPIVSSNAKPDDSLKFEAMPGRQIVLGWLVTRAISITEVVTYLSQQTGVAGWFNKMLTGDPRGVCLTETCELVKTQVVLYVTVETNGETTSWTTMAAAMEKKMVLDQVLGKAMEEGLRPLAETVEGNGKT